MLQIIKDGQRHLSDILDTWINKRKWIFFFYTAIFIFGLYLYNDYLNRNVEKVKAVTQMVSGYSNTKGLYDSIMLYLFAQGYSFENACLEIYKKEDLRSKYKDVKLR